MSRFLNFKFRKNNVKNVGSTIYFQKNPIKSLTAGTGVTIDNNNGNIVLNATATPTSESLELKGVEWLGVEEDTATQNYSNATKINGVLSLFQNNGINDYRLDYPLVYRDKYGKLSNLYNKNVTFLNEQQFNVFEIIVEDKSYTVFVATNKKDNVQLSIADDKHIQTTDLKEQLKGVAYVVFDNFPSSEQSCGHFKKYENGVFVEDMPQGPHNVLSYNDYYYAVKPIQSVSVVFKRTNGATITTITVNSQEQLDNAMTSNGFTFVRHEPQYGLSCANTSATFANLTDSSVIVVTTDEPEPESPIDIPL